MNLYSHKSSLDATAPTFIGLAHSLNGWVLVETTLVLQGAGFRSHLIAALIALGLAFYSVRPFRLPKKSAAENVVASSTRHKRSPAARTAWALLLLTTGAVHGAAITSDSILLVCFVAIVLSLIPWSRILFCRDRIVLAAILMCSGMALPLFVDHRSISPVFLLFSAWISLLCATLINLGRVSQLWRVEREARAAHVSVSDSPAKS